MICLCFSIKSDTSTKLQLIFKLLLAFKKFQIKKKVKLDNHYLKLLPNFFLCRNKYPEFYFCYLNIK